MLVDISSLTDAQVEPALKASKERLDAVLTLLNALKEEATSLQGQIRCLNRMKHDLEVKEPDDSDFPMIPPRRDTNLDAIVDHDASRLRVLETVMARAVEAVNTFKLIGPDFAIDNLVDALKFAGVKETALPKRVGFNVGVDAILARSCFNLAMAVASKNVEAVVRESAEVSKHFKHEDVCFHLADMEGPAYRAEFVRLVEEAFAKSGFSFVPPHVMRLLAVAKNMYDCWGGPDSEEAGALGLFWRAWAGMIDLKPENEPGQPELTPAASFIKDKIKDIAKFDITNEEANSLADVFPGHFVPDTDYLEQVRAATDELKRWSVMQPSNVLEPKTLMALFKSLDISSHPHDSIESLTKAINDALHVKLEVPSVAVLPELTGDDLLSLVYPRIQDDATECAKNVNHWFNSRTPWVSSALAGTAITMSGMVNDLVRHASNTLEEAFDDDKIKEAVDKLPVLAKNLTVGMHQAKYALDRSILYGRVNADGEG